MIDVTTMLDAVDRFRARYVLKALDAVMTARLHPPARGERVWGRPAQGSNYGKVQRVVSGMAGALPGGFEWLFRRLYKPGGLPFVNGRSARLLDCGSAMTVFLIAGGARRKDWVLKVSRSSLGRRPGALARAARSESATYRRLRSWHAGSAIVLPTFYVILQSPLLSRTALAQVQPHLAGPLRDLFTDVSEAELVKLLEHNEHLRRQFTLFARETLGAVEREGACVDLVGSRNIVLVGDRSRSRLFLMDIGIHTLAAREKKDPVAWAETRKRLAYLRRLSDDVRPPLEACAAGTRGA